MAHSFFLIGSRRLSLPHKKGACFRRLPLCLTYALGGKVMPPTFTLTADTSRPVMDSTALLTLS